MASTNPPGAGGGRGGRQTRRWERVSARGGNTGKGDGEGSRGGRGWPKKANPQFGGQGEGKRAYPTHFLALPLNNHPVLRAKIGAFQSALLAQGRNPLQASGSSKPIGGLDQSIVIDPMRLHLTLGVMALERDEPDRGATSVPTSSTSTQPTRTPAPVKKTPRTALALLNSLRPRILHILNGEESVKVTLDEMGWFPEAARNRDSGKNVLFFGPGGVEHQKLWAVSNLIHQTFKREGYITETRPLKLHCTVLNTSHRQPRNFRLGFDIGDVLASDAMRGLRSEAGTSETAVNEGKVKVDSLGTYDVRGFQLWVMGSHGPNNEYVSCGGISLS